MDYSAHIARSFLAVKGESRQERAVKALAHIGGAVLNGAGSTFLAVFVLVAASSYIFYVFWSVSGRRWGTPLGGLTNRRAWPDPLV